MSAKEIINRVDKCRATGRGQWISLCPSHTDKSPSLSIGETEDGRTLIHCHGGCSALDVLTAIGLSWDSLYPEEDKHFKSMMSHVHSKPTVNDYVMDISRHQSERLSEGDRGRLKKAALSGGEPLGFAETVFKEASEPLPSEYLTSIDSEADFDALKTEAAWHFNEIDKGNG
tara:strand:- start:2787 stop:3302 length:516 start_codon:yes stop_codon:yes gene_type:complete